MADPRADVEVVALLWRILSDLRLPGLTLEINNLGYSSDREATVPGLCLICAAEKKGSARTADDG